MDYIVTIVFASSADKSRPRGYRVRVCIDISGKKVLCIAGYTNNFIIVF